MKILLKLFIVILCTTSLLSGCCLLSFRDQPLPAAETLSMPQAAEVTAPVEVAPSATAAPIATPANNKPISLTGGQSSKPRLSYTVSDGELLWTIAKRPDVYGDPLLWPLLYQANRDQIKDPRKIYAGQTLTIPRNVSEEEKEKTRIFAKKSDFFSPE
jgi:nucleoid-associated protein YgaU